MDALVAYGSDSEDEQQHQQQKQVDEEEQQRQYQRRKHDEGRKVVDTPLVEPRPPRRQSDMFDEEDEVAEAIYGSERRRDDEEEEDEELDSLLEKGLSTAKYSDSMLNIDSSGGGSTPGLGYTPRSVCSADEPMDMAGSPATAIQHRDLPPSPRGECDPELAQRFRTFFEKKERGVDMNASIKRRKDYINPSLYEALRNAYGIDETGTCFARTVYDPNAFNADDFYDVLGDHQATQEQHRKKVQQQQEHHHKRPASFPTAGGGASKAK